MNLSTLTSRQWVYVLHRMDHPDEEPLDHPGNPRNQNLDRIADQLSEQLDGDELQALRDMVAGKRPRGDAYDEEAGRDLDAETVDEDDGEPDAPLDDMEAYIARAFRPARQGEAGAQRRTRVADAAWGQPSD